MSAEDARLFEPQMLAVAEVHAFIRFRLFGCEARARALLVGGGQLRKPP